MKGAELRETYPTAIAAVAAHHAVVDGDGGDVASWTWYQWRDGCWARVGRVGCVLGASPT